MNDQVLVVFVTVPSLETGRQIARTLVGKGLAACVNIIPKVNSIYAWEGQVQDEEEALLLIKSRRELFETRLIPTVCSIHPYQLPEIVALPVQMGLPAYLDWIVQVTSESDNRPEKS
jgi:periplasmic divalent cation tolerance protein